MSKSRGRSAVSVVLLAVLILGMMPANPAAAWKMNAKSPSRTAAVASSTESATTQPSDIAGARVLRIQGAGASGNSIAASKKGWTKSSYVVITDGGSQALQCVAAPLAGAYGGPLLLSKKGRLTAATVKEIKRLGARRAFVVGGSKTNYKRTYSALKKARVKTVTRLAGSTVAGTAVAVAKRITSRTHGSRGVLIVNSKYPRYAVGALPMAGRLGLPVLFTSTKTMPSVTRSFLKKYRPAEIIAIGSTKLVSAGVSARAGKDARVSGARLMRISSKDVYDAAARSAEFAFAQGLSYQTTVMASLDKPSDLYTGAVFAGRLGGSVVITRRSSLPVRTDDFILNHSSSIRVFYLMGDGRTIATHGETALSRSTRTMFQPNVEVVGDALNSKLTSISPDSRRLFFRADADLTTLQPGDIVVSEPSSAAPNGYLLQVLTVRPADASGLVAVDTTLAALSQVFKQGAIDIRAGSGNAPAAIGGISTGDAIPVGESGSRQLGLYSPAATWTLFSLTVPLGREFYKSSAARVWTEGSLSMQLKCVANMSWGATAWVTIDHHCWVCTYHGREAYMWGPRSFELTPQFYETLKLTLNWEGGWSGRKEFELMSRTSLGKLNFMIGPIPVNISFYVTPVVELEASVKAKGSVTVTQNFAVQFGYKWDINGGGRSVSGPVPGVKQGFTMSTPMASATGSAKASVGLKFTAMLYSAAGMSATPRVYVRVAADTTWRPWFKAYTGLECAWGVELNLADLWKKSWRIGTTNIWEKQLWPNGSDKRPPVTTVKMPTVDGSNGWYVSPTKIVEWSTNEAATATYLSVLGIRVFRDQSSFRFGDVFSPGSEGVQTLKYFSDDSSGNREAERSLTLRFDSKAPTNPTLNSSTPVSVPSSATAVSVVLTGGTDAASGVDGFSVIWSKDTAQLPDATLDTTSRTVSTTLTEGSWYCNVRTRDKAGNWAATSASRGPFVIDKTGPTVVSSTPTNNATGWEPGVVSFVFAESIGARSARVYSREGSVWSEVPYDIGYFILNWNEGTRTLELGTEGWNPGTSYRVDLTASDRAGNPMPLLHFYFTTAPPM